MNFTQFNFPNRFMKRYRPLKMDRVNVVKKNRRVISIVQRPMTMMRPKKLQSHQPNQGHVSPISLTFCIFVSGQRVG